MTYVARAAARLTTTPERTPKSPDAQIDRAVNVATVSPAVVMATPPAVVAPMAMVPPMAPMAAEIGTDGPIRNARTGILGGRSRVCRHTGKQGRDRDDGAKSGHDPPPLE